MHFEDEDTLCGAGKTDCCCCRLLFTQPDFENQKSHLEEYITSWGHICGFYPKYHCKLNFIKQYWGAAKLIYRSSTRTRDMKETEENVKNSLDDVPIVQIQWWASSPRIWTCHWSYIISYANRAPVYQCLWPGFEWSRSGLGKLKIPWPSNIASRDGYKVEKRAQEEVWYTDQ